MVTGGSANNPYISPGASGAGMVRWNPNMNCLEVNDGNMWKEISGGFASVGLSSEAESLLDWAREERNKQYSIQAMAVDHPAVKNALEAVNRAKEQLDLVYKLSKDFENESEGEVTGP